MSQKPQERQFLSVPEACGNSGWKESAIEAADAADMKADKLRRTEKELMDAERAELLKEFGPTMFKLFGIRVSGTPDFESGEIVVDGVRFECCLALSGPTCDQNGPIQGSRSSWLGPQSISIIGKCGFCGEEVCSPVLNTLADLGEAIRDYPLLYKKRSTCKAGCKGNEPELTA